MKYKKYFVHFLIILTFIVHLSSINNNYYDVSDTYKYLVTAKSISMLKYSRVHLVNEPTENLLLPLFPLVLSPFYFFDINSMYLMRLYISLMALLLSYLIYFLLQKISEFNNIESAFITFIISLAPMYSIYSIAMETTIFYLIIIILLFLTIYHKFKNTKLQLIYLFLILIAAMLTRPNAIILFPSLLIYALLNKKYKLIWPTIISLILSFLFLFFTKNAYFFGSTYEKILNHGVTNIDSELSLLNLISAKTAIFIKNLYGYLLYWLPSNIFPVNLFIQNISTILMIIFSLIIIVPVTIGFFRRLNLKSYIDIYFIFSFLFFMFVFSATANGRYMFPVLPIFIYYFYFGSKYLISILKRNYNKLNFISFKFLLLIFAFMVFLFSSAMAYKKHYKKQPSQWDDIVEIANYIKININHKSKLYTNSGKTHEIFLISSIPFSFKDEHIVKNDISAYYLKEKDMISNMSCSCNGVLIYKSKHGYYELYSMKNLQTQSF